MFVKLIPKYLVFLTTIVNGICFRNYLLKLVGIED